MKLAFTLLCITCMHSLALSQVYYANKEWQESNGIPTAIDIEEASVLDFQENLIIVGHTAHPTENTNILITKYNQDGVKLWERSYNHILNSSDYGTAIVVDEFNNYYIGGNVSTNGGNAYDFVVLKL